METLEQTIKIRNTKNLNTKDAVLKPLFINVIIAPYKENPFRMIEQSEGGVILGIESIRKKKSDETGEMVDVQDVITCARVIACGPDCRYVKEGDDVFVATYMANELPYKGKGYKVVSESNIICKVE